MKSWTQILNSNRENYDSQEWVAEGFSPQRKVKKKRVYEEKSEEEEEGWNPLKKNILQPDQF